MKTPEMLARVDFEHVWHPFTQQKIWFELGEPLIIQRGEGMELIDVHGRRYLDGVSSLWCNVHGHGVPELLKALHEQVDLLCHSTMLGLTHVPALELTEELLKVTPANLPRVFYSDSGAAAVEAAIRMSMEWWQKQGTAAGKKKTKFLSLSNAYHGDTLGAVSLGYLEEFHHHLKPLFVPSFQVHAPHVFRFYEGMSETVALEQSLEALRRVLAKEADTIAAFIVEPLVQGAAGMWVQPIEYLREAARLCREHNVFFIADEVATGFGKTGSMFAVEQAGVTPDILIIGKGLSGGYLPISAALATDQIFSGFLGEPSELKAFYYGQTFAGNPLAARVSTANLALFRDNKVLEALQPKIAHFWQEIRAKIEPLPQVDEVRGMGVMVAIELTDTPGTRSPYPADERAGNRVVAAARANGVILRPLGNIITLMPPLTMSEFDLTRLVTTAAEAIASLE